jgi:hypothetical protein
MADLSTGTRPRRARHWAVAGIVGLVASRVPAVPLSAVGVGSGPDGYVVLLLAALATGAVVTGLVVRARTAGDWLRAAALALLSQVSLGAVLLLFFLRGGL